MLTIKSILVPSDFSECSDGALRYALALNETLGARLHLLHVVQDPYTQPWAPEAFTAPLGDMLNEWVEQARNRLSEAVPDAHRHSTLVTTVVGTPAAEIVRYAEDRTIDLIVIGTHGRGPIGHALLGSVTERVVRKAPCPVLTVRQTQR
jgi:universal stress protein A